MIEIYTDGGCRGNHLKNNVGGYGGVLIFKDKNGKEHIKEYCGSKLNTTNNEMELLAFINGLTSVKLTYKDHMIVMYTDSMYVVNGFNKWMQGWKRSGWCNKKNEQIANVELWKEIDKIRQIYTSVQVHHVKGHAGNKYNEIADQLANKAMNEVKHG